MDIPASERKNKATEGLERVTKGWKRIQRMIVNELHKTYNESWAEPEEGHHCVLVTFSRFMALLSAGVAVAAGGLGLPVESPPPDI